MDRHQIKVTLKPDDYEKFLEIKEFTGNDSDAEVVRSVLKAAHDHLVEYQTLFDNTKMLTKLNERIDDIDKRLTNFTSNKNFDYLLKPGFIKLIKRLKEDVEIINDILDHK